MKRQEINQQLDELSIAVSGVAIETLTAQMISILKDTAGMERAAAIVGEAGSTGPALATAIISCFDNASAAARQELGLPPAPEPLAYLLMH